MDAERLGSMSGWCWESVPGEVPKALSMSFSAEGMREGKGERERGRGRGGERGRETFIICLLYYRKYHDTMDDSKFSSHSTMH